MYLAPILILIIIRFLRKSLETKLSLPGWDRILLAGMGLAIAILLAAVIVPATTPVLIWLAYAALVVLALLPFYKQEFRGGRPVIYACIPIIVIALADDITKLTNAAFLKTWDDYFDAANLFAIAWMIAMFSLNKKQRNALQKEKLKIIEIEKERKSSEALKVMLELQVKERTAALTTQKEALETTLDELRSTQTQLIQSEKMASLGELTAGIAHEIQNPLNFVNNFSEINVELIAEMITEIGNGNIHEAKALASDISANEVKINYHGKRADNIVKGMLQHSRSGAGVMELTDINNLADEYLRLAYHGLRAKDKTFNASMKTSYDENIGSLMVVPQDIGRAVLNLITNAFYAVSEKKKNVGVDYEPLVTVQTKKLTDKIQIIVGDNGMGVPKNVLDKIFQPFFTTKPTGSGTGLGLSMSYEIVTKGHAGELKVETIPGQGSEFIITLPSIKPTPLK